MGTQRSVPRQFCVEAPTVRKYHSTWAVAKGDFVRAWAENVGSHSWGQMSEVFAASIGWEKDVSKFKAQAPKVVVVVVDVDLCVFKVESPSGCCISDVHCPR